MYKLNQIVETTFNGRWVTAIVTDMPPNGDDTYILTTTSACPIARHNDQIRETFLFHVIDHMKFADKLLRKLMPDVKPILTFRSHSNDAAVKHARTMVPTPAGVKYSVWKDDGYKGVEFVNFIKTNRPAQFEPLPLG